jgi:glycosyltransferase involved in cell wall biosynthesis
MTPTVSVCVPTYNGARFVERTVRSVLAQTYDDLELIVQDDGSTDSTIDVVAAIADPRLRVLEDRAHVGAAANFNRSFSSARGRYLKVLCQDDVIFPECLAQQVKAIEDGANRGVVLVGARRDVIDEHDRVLWHGRGWRGAAGVIDGPDAIRASVRAGTNLIGEPSAVLCDVALVRSLQGFDTTLAYPVDIDLWIRMLRFGNVAYVPESLATFRVSTTSWSADLSRHQARQSRELVRSVRARNPDIVRATDVVCGIARATASAWARRGYFFVNAHRRSLVPGIAARNVSSAG